MLQPLAKLLLIILFESHYSCGPITVHYFDSTMEQINLREQRVLVKLNIAFFLSEVSHVFYSLPRNVKQSKVHISMNTHDPLVFINLH
jgi:hypothetical protein